MGHWAVLSCLDIRNTLDINHDIVWHKVGLLERLMVIVLSLHKTWASLAGA
jgi:hypothetical protein